ncbi:MAG: tetratricopeptide repeat protein [Chthonomonadaceae bacterium]|nr:tetratricopeptide repeat protein [Chthonomonadaceae bacterium]
MAKTSRNEIVQDAALSLPHKDGTAAGAARAYFDRGTAWAQIGAYEQALDAWKQALGLAPDLAEAYAAIGSVYMTLGCWQEAVRIYQKAILAAPDLLECYYGLGSAYGRLGEFDRAIEAYEQAFKLIPIEADRNREAVVACLDSPATGSLRLEPDPFQDRLRSDTEGFDFSALLSSPTARRHAVRQEAPNLPPMTFETALTPAENASRTESYSHAPRDGFAISGADSKLHAVAAEVASEPEADDEASYEVLPARDRRALAVLMVLLVVLVFMGGRMVVNAVIEKRERDAYLAATQRNFQNRRGIPEKPPSGRGLE